jgi:hypothetical protein
MVFILMNMTFNFLLQATRVLHYNNYDDNELEMIYNFLIALENDTLNDYNNTCTILSYNNDLELYIEILDVVIDVYEEREDYERCQKLKEMKDKSIKIMKNKTI